MSQPGLGAYRWDEGWQRYQRRSLDPDTAGAQLSLPLGMARYQFSEYQAGITGISRIELIGSFYEKWFTMQMLTQRGWTTGYTRDVPFWTNYYDLFPVEMQQIFTGYDSRRARGHRPARSSVRPVRSRTVRTRGWSTRTSTAATARPRPPAARASRTASATTRSSRRARTSRSSFLATVFALSDFPVFFDTSFQNQLFVCIEGNGACFEPSEGDVQYVPGVTDVEDADYAKFFSERYGKTFVAWQIEPSVGVPNQTSIGFEMVRDAEETQFLLLALQTYRGDFGGDPLDAGNLDGATRDRLDDLGYTLPTSVSFLDDEVDRLDDHLRDRESFFFQLIQLENQFGVRSYLRF